VASHSQRGITLAFSAGLLLTILILQPIYGTAVSTAEAMSGSGTWTLSTQTSSASMSSVSCVSPTYCVSAGAFAGGVGEDLVSTDRGISWINPGSQSTQPPINAVDCPSISECLYVGGQAAGAAPFVLDGLPGQVGIAISQQLPLLGATGTFAGVSCATPSACVVVGSTAAGLGDGLPGPIVLVGTPSTSFTQPGSWQTGLLPGELPSNELYSGGEPSGGTNAGGLASVDCANSRVCVAVGWQLTPAGNGLSASPLVETSTNGGDNWTTGSLPAGVSSSQGILEDLTCPTPSFCLAVGSQFEGSAVPLALETLDGGASWQAVILPKLGQATALISVSCTSVHSCIGVGGHEALNNSDIYQSVPMNDAPLVMYEGNHNGWVKLTAKGAGHVEVASIKCVTTSECVVAGTDGDGALEFRSGIYNVGNYLADQIKSNAGWLVERANANGGSIYQSVYCSSSENCLVASPGPTAILRSTDGGKRWANSVTPSSSSEPGSLACVPGGTACIAAAVSDGGTTSLLVSQNGGASWTSADLPSGSPLTQGAVEGLSCETTDVCLAVGTSQQGTGFIERTTDGGSTWSSVAAPGTLGEAGGLSAVDCTSDGLCVGAGNTGQDQSAVLIASSNGGSSWNLTNPSRSVSSADTLSGVSCFKPSDCIVVGGNVGAVASYTTDGGATWMKARMPSTIASVKAVACTSAGYCGAVGFGPIGATVVSSADGGKVWSNDAVPTNVGESEPNSIACYKENTCLVAAGAVVASSGEDVLFRASL
jgi:hypothetical protein